MTVPLNPLVTLEVITQRLAIIFPESFPDRNILVGPMACRVIFVFLYGGFIGGHNRYLRPSHIYLFTEEQSQKTSDHERSLWLSNAAKSGFRPEGTRWYADNSREGIRDDLMRNQFLRLGITHKNAPAGHSVTSSKPIHYLDSEFAALFDAAISLDEFPARADAWRTTHLNQATLNRMALRAQGIQAKSNDILIDMPDGTRIRLSSGASNAILKDLIEQFAVIHLENPVVLWVSASDKKSYPQFVETSASIGLKFNVGMELPDLILADMKDPITFYMCEVVATDGAMTELRKDSLLKIINNSDIPEQCVSFLSAFEDRNSAPFRKNFSALSTNSLMWFRTEPDLLVSLKIRDPKGGASH